MLLINAENFYFVSLQRQSYLLRSNGLSVIYRHFMGFEENDLTKTSSPCTHLFESIDFDTFFNKFFAFIEKLDLT